MAGTDRLSWYREATEARLNVILPPADASPTELHQAMRYSALAPGKRLRPALAMASAEAFSGQPESALDAGCAAELIHCFSLIHDDLPSIDDDDLRRGRPTCHVKFGEAMAILAGDALFALAFEVISECSSDHGLVSQCVRVLSRATGSSGLVGGEVLDILSEGGEPDFDLLNVIHRQKTGALIAASCEMGALLGGATRQQAEKMAQFGMTIGLAFQIADDILNETGSAEELGKAVGSDSDRRKLTYPSVIGIEASQQAAREMLDQAITFLDSAPGDTSPLRELAGFAIARNH